MVLEQAQVKQLSISDVTDALPWQQCKTIVVLIKKQRKGDFFDSILKGFASSRRYFYFDSEFYKLK